MMKTLVIVLTLVLTLTAFAGCSEEAEESGIQLASDPIESYDTVSVFLPEDEESTEGASDSNEENEETQSEVAGFVIKEKKFRYGEQDIVLLNIENKTGKDYTLTVNGTYFDESGNVLRNETQSFEDFVAGYQGYFVFHPEMAFDTFSFTLSYNHFTGTPKLSNVKLLKWDKETAFFMVWQEQLIELAGIDDTIYNTLSTNYKFINENDVTLHVKRVMIAIDSNDEIISIKPFGYEKVGPHEFGGGTFRLYHTLDSMTKDPQTWPKHLQGEIQLIMIPLDALTEEEYSEMF